MRPDASENSQITPSTIVRAAGAAGSQPHLASGFQGRCKIATLHAGFGVIRGMSVQICVQWPNQFAGPQKLQWRMRFGLACVEADQPRTVDLDKISIEPQARKIAPS